MASADSSAESSIEEDGDDTERVPVLDIYPGELGLILIMWISSGYMWYGSYDYSGMAGFFPRVMSIIVFALSSVLLFRAFFPDPIRVAIEGGTTSISDAMAPDDDEDDPTDASDKDNPTDASDEDEQELQRNSADKKTMVVGGLTGLYMLVGYLIGLLWATPLYVYVYLRYAEYSRRFSAGLSVATFVIAFGMMEIFRFPLEDGWIMDVLGIEVMLHVTAHGTAALLALLGVI